MKTFFIFFPLFLTIIIIIIILFCSPSFGAPVC